MGVASFLFLPNLSGAQQPDADPDAQPEASQPQVQDQNQAASVSVSGEGSRIPVRGLVRNALTGEPLVRALVRVEGDAATGALTDGEGRFEISGLPVGPQIFEVRKPGFYDRPATASDEEQDATGSAHNVLVAAQMPELIFSLAPAGAIRGQIVLSTGDPAQGFAVELLRRTIVDGRAVWQMASTTKTNSEGIYRFAGLTAGAYVLYTEPAMESEAATSLVEPGSGGAVVRSGYASVFYPDTRDLAGAAKIQIAGGEQVQANFALKLEPFHAVSAVAVFPRGGSSPSEAEGNLTATVLDSASHRLPYAAQVDPATHTIQTTLPDGSYVLLLTAQPQDQNRVLRGRYYSVSSVPNFGTLAGSAQLSISGHAVTNLRIPLSILPTPQVQLTELHSGEQTGKTGQGSIEVMASQTGEWISDGLTTSYAQKMQPGANPAAALSPGSYWVSAFTSSSGFCEQSFTAAGSSLAREPLTVSFTGTAPLMELILRDDCARLTLSLPQSLTATPPGEEPYYTVYAVPNFDTTAGVEALTLRPSSGGTVTLDGLTPGNYRVYTFEGPAQLEYRNPAALAALPIPGQAVTLSPGMESNLVLEVPESR